MRTLTLQSPGQVNYDSGLLSVFVNQVLLEHGHTHPFPSVAMAFPLQQECSSYGKNCMAPKA